VPKPTVGDVVEMLGQEVPRHQSDVRQTFAVFVANLRIFLSYKTWVATETITTSASVVMYYFVGFLVEPDRLAMAGYGTSYIGFALIGVASTNYLWMCINRLSHSMSHEIREGTFETVISSPIRLRSYVIGIAIRGFLVSCYFMLGAFILGVYVLRAPLILNAGTVSSAVAIIFLLITSHLGIGIMAAGVIMVYKKGDPLTFLFTGLTEFFGGVLFPLYLLKSYPALWTFAWTLPYTHALDALRKVLLLGETAASPSIAGKMVLLIGYTVVTLPLSLLFFRWGYDRIRREGTTTTY
jgi:ABC-2 type transport system permease protein